MVLDRAMAAAVCKRSETVSSEGLSSLDRLVCDQEVFRGRGARKVSAYVFETNYLGRETTGSMDSSRRTRTRSRSWTRSSQG